MLNLSHRHFALFVIFILFNVLFVNEVNGQQSVANGFYRVQCSSLQQDLDGISSRRYISVIDNKGFSISDILEQYLGGNSNPNLDLHAVRMITEGDEISDPSTVIYIEYTNNKGYKLNACGSGTYDITGEYLNINSKGDGTYNAYAYKKFSVLFFSKEVYIYLEDDKGFDKASAGEVASTRWYIKPLDTGTGGDTYFGVSPTFKLGRDNNGNDYYYTTLRAPFSYKLSDNVHAFQMTANGEITALQSSVIAANTPVILQCSSNNPSENRLYPQSMGSTYSNQASSSAGLYNGKSYSYFKTAVVNSHVNQTSENYPRGESAGFGTPDPSTNTIVIRVLSVKDGKLGFFDSFASAYPEDKCLNGELAYFRLSTSNEDANGGMTIVETPTITPPAETEVLVGESLTFKATFAAKAQRPNIKLQYSLDGQNWTDTDGTISITSDTEIENGTLYVRTYNGGIPSDVVTATYSFLPKSVHIADLPSNPDGFSYKIIDPLTVAYVDYVNNTIYAKDNNGASVQNPGEGETDFMKEHYKNGTHADHSNWVAIEVASEPSVETYNTIDAIGKVKEGSFPNRRIVGRVKKLDDDDSFSYNTYCVVNFMDKTFHKGYFFASPAANEVANIIWAQYADKNTFIAPPSSTFDGGFTADFSLYNGTVPTLTPGHVYGFLALIEKTATTASGISPKATMTSGYKVYPLEEMKDWSNTVTGVTTVQAAGNVVSVKYYNAMGVESSVPFNGVNIVVTTYDNGTRTTSKMIR